MYLYFALGNNLQRNVSRLILSLQPGEERKERPRLGSARLVYHQDLNSTGQEWIKNHKGYSEIKYYVYISFCVFPAILRKENPPLTHSTLRRTSPTGRVYNGSKWAVNLLPDHRATGNSTPKRDLPPRTHTTLNRTFPRRKGLPRKSVIITTKSGFCKLKKNELPDLQTTLLKIHFP